MTEINTCHCMKLTQSYTVLHSKWLKLFCLSMIERERGREREKEREREGEGE